MSGLLRSLIITSLLALAGTGIAAPLLNDDELLSALRGGGFNIYFRHVATDWSLSDQVKKVDDWRSCDPSRMRQLSDAGRDHARRIGGAMRRLQIPVGEVIASPYCRTRETAELMRLGPVVESFQVMNLRAAAFVGGRSGIITNARSLLASSPVPGTNRVIVAHGNVAREATPVYPEEGEALVFHPVGEDSFTLRARIGVKDWSQLLDLAGN